MNNVVSKTFQPQNLSRLQQHAHLSAWQKNWQKQSLQAFLQQGFPTRKNEDWKYTPLNHLAEQEFELVVPTKISPSQMGLDNTYRIVLANGQYREDLSECHELNGIYVLSWQQACEQYADNMQKLLTSLATTPMSLLNTALNHSGVVIYIAKNTRIDKPLHLLSVTQHAEGQMMHPRCLMIFEENCEMTLLEEYQGDDTYYFNNTVMTIVLGENSILNHYKLQNESKRAFHIALTQIEQATHSQVNYYGVTLGGKLARDDLQIQLKGQGAQCQLLGLAQPKAQQHVDLHSRIDHLVPHTSSQQHYRSIADDKARSVFNGKVIVHPKASKSSAHQLNKNLLLSAFAEVDTKPELEIYNDDVQCTHGATVGELDKNALFYLRSRGISETIARELLIEAFGQEILLQLPDGRISEYVLNLCALSSL